MQKEKREPFDSRFVPPQVVPIMPCVQGQPLLFIAPRGVELLRSDRRATCADQPSTSRRESSRASQACSSGWGTACRRAFVCQTCIALTARRSKPSTPDTRQRAFLTPTSPGSRSRSCDAQSSFRVQYDSSVSCYKSQISFFRGSNGFSRHKSRRATEVTLPAHRYLQKEKREPFDSRFVPPQGLEPWTPTLRVSCSTN